MARKTQLSKLGIIPCVIFTMLTVAEVCAQKALPQTVVSVDGSNISLREFLARLTDKTGISFSYNPKRIPVQQKINYGLVTQSFAVIMKRLSLDFGLRFEFIEDQIIVKPDDGAGRATWQTGTLSGTIKDAGSGEALIGASVFIHELQTGAVTNAFGFYSLTIPPGTYTVSTSFVGYRDTTRVVDLNASLKADVFLEEEFPLLDEVVVSSTPSVTHQIVAGMTDIRPATVDDRPEFFGEADVVKSLESVPGVKFHSDGSTFYYVRGGHRDQNLVLIDDAPIYNPSHLLGMFSSIIPDAVNDITLYKGYRPAAFGGRLSSVLDVRTKKGNDQHFQAWGNVGLISTKIGIEGPFRKNASSYLLSGRFSSLQWLFKRAGENIDRLNFHDLTGKVNVRFNPSNRAFFSFYSGADNYFGANTGISWSNNAVAVQWNHLFGDRLFLNTTMAAGSYDYFVYTDVQNDSKWNSHISNFNLKTDFSYFIRPENEMTFGTGINGYAFNPGNFESRVNLAMLPSLSVRNSLELMLYGNHEIKVNDRMGVNYGVRLSSWSNHGEAFEFRFDSNRNPTDTLYFEAGESYKTFLNAEPRIAVTYFVGDHASLKATHARNVQNVHLISNSISPFTSLDVWLPSSYNIKPQSANEFSVGYYHTFPKSATHFSVETFFKTMSNQIDYDTHAEILLNPLLERELRFGGATSYGIEAIIRKEEGRLHGWFSYTGSKARRKFPDVNEGRAYDAFYDRPHQVTVMALYDLTRRWKVGANWIYLTGAPYSSPVSFFSFNGEEVPIYGQKNNARLPDYHRLDLSATYRLNRNPENRYSHNLSFSIYNFYGRKNALFVNYNKVETTDGTLRIPADLTDPIRVTSQYYLFGFTPSVSYNFKWL